MMRCIAFGHSWSNSGLHTRLILNVAVGGLFLYYNTPSLIQKEKQ